MRWTPDGVIAWTHSGDKIHLGRHSLDKTSKIADELGYALYVPEQFTVAPGFGAEQARLPLSSPSANGGNSQRNVSQGGGSFTVETVGTAQPKKLIDPVLPSQHSHCHLNRIEVIHT